MVPSFPLTSFENVVQCVICSSQPPRIFRVVSTACGGWCLLHVCCCVRGLKALYLPQVHGLERVAYVHFEQRMSPIFLRASVDPANSPHHLVSDC